MELFSATWCSDARDMGVPRGQLQNFSRASTMEDTGDSVMCSGEIDKTI
jgi:hypothetical protein